MQTRAALLCLLALAAAGAAHACSHVYFAQEEHLQAHHRSLLAVRWTGGGVGRGATGCCWRRCVHYHYPSARPSCPPRQAAGDWNYKNNGADWTGDCKGRAQSPIGITTSSECQPRVRSGGPCSFRQGQRLACASTTPTRACTCVPWCMHLCPLACYLASSWVGPRPAAACCTARPAAKASAPAALRPTPLTLAFIFPPTARCTPYLTGRASPSIPSSSFRPPPCRAVQEHARGWPRQAEVRHCQGAQGEECRSSTTAVRAVLVPAPCTASAASPAGCLGPHQVIWRGAKVIHKSLVAWPASQAFVLVVGMAGSDSPRSG